MSLDEVDRHIIRILRTSGRESYTEMAAAVGTSEGTIRSRVKRLVEEGTIRQFTIRTAGSHVKALVEVTVEANVHTADIAKRIRDWDGVETVWEVTGDQDILVVADCPTTGDLNVIIDKIRSIPGTQATRSRLILKEL
ncbi:MAG: Lrp/AsnC family transcriptional regulator [Candidatus Thermoplasmatota archaeon]